jgi:hypothetical protein
MASDRELIRWHAGLCRRCPNKRGAGAILCDRCMDLERERRRKATGSKPWKPGGPGRPPKKRGQNPVVFPPDSVDKSGGQTERST